MRVLISNHVLDHPHGRKILGLDKKLLLFVKIVSTQCEDIYTYNMSEYTNFRNTSIYVSSFNMLIEIFETIFKNRIKKYHCLFLQQNSQCLCMIVSRGTETHKD